MVAVVSFSLCMVFSSFISERERQADLIRRFAKADEDKAAAMKAANDLADKVKKTAFSDTPVLWVAWLLLFLTITYTAAWVFSDSISKSKTQLRIQFACTVVPREGFLNAEPCSVDEVCQGAETHRYDIPLLGELVWQTVPNNVEATCAKDLRFIEGDDMDLISMRRVCQLGYYYDSKDQACKGLSPPTATKSLFLEDQRSWFWTPELMITSKGADNSDKRKASEEDLHELQLTCASWFQMTIPASKRCSYQVPLEKVCSPGPVTFCEGVSPDARLKWGQSPSFARIMFWYARLLSPYLVTIVFFYISSSVLLEAYSDNKRRLLLSKLPSLGSIASAVVVDYTGSYQLIGRAGHSQDD